MTINLYERQQQDAWALHRAERAMQATVHSLKRLLSDEAPHRTRVSTHPKDNGAFVVVGAGPDVVNHIDYLKQAYSRATILAVNAIMPGLADAGVRVDAVVCRESIDQSHHLAKGWYNAAILDVSCHEKTWEVARQNTRDVTMFVPSATQFWPLAHALDLQPVYGGVAAITSAVAIAKMMGALQIVLIGCDLAIDGDAIYGPMSAYGRVGAKIDGDKVHLENTNELRRGARAAGVREEPDVQHVANAECWDGKFRAQPRGWGDQHRWLSQFGESMRQYVELFDLGQKGCVKKGWHCPQGGGDTADLWASSPAIIGEAIDRKRARAFVDSVKGDAEWLLEVSEGRKSPFDLGPRITTGIVEAMAAGGITYARDLASVEDRLAHTYLALANAARWRLATLAD